ncbi:MAG: MarR family winged helix-turn-helix transcriptional regulator [Vulcanimicrobiota bacterium]|nr:MarR family transcriptional regulator [Candidatus Eremiobacteraeota bacterium]
MDGDGRARVSQADYEALAEFRLALRLFTDFSRQAARREGLPPMQHQALLAIRGAPLGQQVSIGSLAKSLCSKPQSTSELVTRMERDGLVTRRTNHEDARQIWLEITPRGLAVLDRLSSVHRNELRRLRPALERLLAQFDL